MFDVSSLITIANEFMYAIVVVVFFLWYAVARGRQPLINLIFGLYLGLLFSQNLPVDTSVSTDPVVSALISIAAFLVMTVLATAVIAQQMPMGYREKKFESFGKKLFLALAASVLVLLFSYQVLPVDELLTVQTPFRTLFSSSQYFFYWLLAPFVLLYFHR